MTDIFESLKINLLNTLTYKKHLLLHYKSLIISEEDTKFNIVFPIISSFGLSFPQDIKCEHSVYNGRIDIELSYNEEKVIIETKHAHRILTSKDEDQLLKYFQCTSSKLGILTNGDDWQFYIYKNHIMRKIKWIKLSYGIFEDDFTFLLHLLKPNFNINYFLNYSEDV